MSTRTTVNQIKRDLHESRLGLYAEQDRLNRLQHARLAGRLSGLAIDSVVAAQEVKVACCERTILALEQLVATLTTSEKRVRKSQ